MHIAQLQGHQQPCCSESSAAFWCCYDSPAAIGDNLAAKNVHPWMVVCWRLQHHFPLKNVQAMPACKGSSEQHMKPLLGFHLKRNTSKGVNRSSAQQGAQRTGYKRFCLGCIEHNRASVKGKQHDMARSTDIRGKLG
jgi:hypothetical protein